MVVHRHTRPGFGLTYGADVAGFGPFEVTGVENHAPYTPPGGHPAGSTNPRRKLSCKNARVILVTVLGVSVTLPARGTPL